MAIGTAAPERRRKAIVDGSCSSRAAWLPVSSLSLVVAVDMLNADAGTDRC
jgi:hypothetical protein